MNDAENKKVMGALVTVFNLEAALTNFIKRGPMAGKAWKASLADSTLSDESKKKLKTDVIGPLEKLVKAGSKSLKDLRTLFTEGNDPKKHAKYTDAKDFRAKTAKLLESSRTFDSSGGLFLVGLNNILGGGLFPLMSEVNVKVTVQSVKEFAVCFNTLRIALNSI